nr:hypothetical protein [uncultured Desulfobacter sp.]
MQTKLKAGTEAKDAYLTVAETAKKLGINLCDYIADRISKKFNMPCLADLIFDNFTPQIEYHSVISIHSNFMLTQNKDRFFATCHLPLPGL